MLKKQQKLKRVVNVMVGMLTVIIVMGLVTKIVGIVMVKEL